MYIYLVTLCESSIHYDKTKKSIRVEHNKGNCIICSQDMTSGEFVTLLDCEHYFHEECIELYLNLTYDNNCLICHKNFPQLRYSSYSNSVYLDNYGWTSRLHYYLKAFPLILLHYITYKYKKITAIILNIIVVLSLLIIIFVANIQPICVISHSLIPIIVIQEIIFITDFELSACTYLNYFLIDWRIEHSTKRAISQYNIQRLIEVILLLIYILLLSAGFYSLQFTERLEEIDTFFYIIICLKIIIDTMDMLGPLFLLFFIITLIFDLVIVLPVTFYYMIYEQKSFKQVNLLG